jgi:uncharacterized membrane protein YccF (DUF307 family)
MSVLGNIIWIIFGGLISAICWSIAGLLLCITIIGIPFGVQCFKIAGLVLAPFGREINDSGMGAGSFIMNIVWIILFGWELAVGHLVLALIFAITIVGIPFAAQHIKLARLALLPFGAEIR